MATVCVDASFIVSLYIHEELSEPAIRLWDNWYASDTDVIAPALLVPEVTSALRKSVHFGRVDEGWGDRAFEAFCQIDVRIIPSHDLLRAAWELARRFNRPVAYDSFYVAAAQREDCPLWTGDHRLVNVFRLPWIRWVGDQPAATGV